MREKVKALDDGLVYWKKQGIGGDGGKGGVQWSGGRKYWKKGWLISGGVSPWPI